VTLTAGRSLGLLLLRLVVGSAFILHGWPKIQNPMHWMDGRGNAPHALLQAAAAIAEFGGGMALILGLLTPLVTLGIAATMVGALVLSHFPKGHPFVPGGPGKGYELSLIYLAIMIALLTTGAGRYSLDALLRRRTEEPAVASEPLRRSTAA
jgi:putative oxidoreductase